jgi:hypothetical protein
MPDTKSESYAVINDFMLKTKNLFLETQKKIFQVGLVILLLGGLIILFQILIGLIVLAIGGAVLSIVFIRKPKYIKSIQKFYWPFSICNISSPYNTDYLTLDMTQKMAPEPLTYSEFKQSSIDKIIKSLPGNIDVYNAEKNTITNLKSINSLHLNYEMSLPVVGTDFFKDVIHLAVPGYNKQHPMLQSIDFNKAKQVTNKISEGFDTSLITYQAVKQRNKALEKNIYSYIQHLGGIYTEEKQYAISNASKILYDIQHAPSFFDPLIDDFHDDILNDLQLIERMGEREMARIEDQIKSDQRTVTMICDSMINQLEGEMRQYETMLNKNATEKQAYEQTKKAMHQAKESALQSIENAQQDIDSAKREMADAKHAGDEARSDAKKARRAGSAKLEALAGGALLWSGHNAKGTMKTKYTENGMEGKFKEGGGFRKTLGTGLMMDGIVKKEHAKTRGEILENRAAIKEEGAMGRATTKIEGAETRAAVHEAENRQYEVGMQQMKANIQAAERYAEALRGTMGTVTDNIKVTLENMENRVSEVLKAGSQRINYIQKTTEEDYDSVKRHFIIVEDMQNFYYDFNDMASEIMLEEIRRHLAPIEERINTFSQEKQRIDNYLKGIAKVSHDYLKFVKEASFPQAREGIYLIPFWKIDYSTGDGENSYLYPISNLDEHGNLHPLWPNFVIDTEWFNYYLGSELEGKVNPELIANINESRAGFKQCAKTDFLDSFLIITGVKKLAGTA